MDTKNLHVRMTPVKSTESLSPMWSWAFRRRSSRLRWCIVVNAAYGTLRFRDMKPRRLGGSDNLECILSGEIGTDGELPISVRMIWGGNFTATVILS